MFQHVNVGIKRPKNAMADARILAQHLGLPHLLAHAIFHGDGFIDREKAVALFLGDAAAIVNQRAGRAFAVVASLQHVENAPLDQSGPRFLRLVDDLAHQPTGTVHS